MGTTLPSLKAVQEQLGDGGGKLVYVFVSPKAEFFERDCTVLKGAVPIGTNHQWLNRTDAEYTAFFATHPGDRNRWWVPTSMLIDASGNVAGWWRGSLMDWRVHVDLFQRLIASAQAR